MSRHHVCPGLAALTLLFSACDARVDSDYQGEPLLKFSGSLSIQNPQATGELRPALAFIDDEYALHILDVETVGEFPGNFTLSVMSPPPAAALHRVEGGPAVALAYITALPPGHASVLEPPPEVDGAGSLGWCDASGDCFRRIELCIVGTDDCYRELARCRSDTERQVCDQIIEQSGDPTIANVWERFGGLSEHHFVLYVADDAPAGSARAYLDKHVPAVVAFAFDHEPLKRGYHLLHSRQQTAEEEAAIEPCAWQAELDGLASVNMLHGTMFASHDELAKAVFAMAPPKFDQHPYIVEKMRATTLSLWEGGCLNGSTGLRMTRLPTGAPVNITIGTRDVQPWW